MSGSTWHQQPPGDPFGAPPPTGPPLAPPESPGWYGTQPPPPQFVPPPPKSFGPYVIAGFGRRASAYLIDVALAVLIAAALSVIVAAIGARTSLAVGLGIFAFLLVMLFLPATAAAITNGQTIGKRMLSIDVVRTDGGRLHFGWTFLREGICKFLMTFIPFWLWVDDLWALGEQGTALHDQMTATRVVRGPRYRNRSLLAVLGGIGAVLVVIGAFAAMAATAPQSSGYTALEHDVFVRGCSKDAQPSECDCVFTYLERHLPYNRWRDWVERYNADPQGAHPPRELLDAFDACGAPTDGVPPAVGPS